MSDSRFGVSPVNYPDPDPGDKSADKANFNNLYSVVTMNIRSRSTKSNKIFKPSQCYNI